MVGAAHLQRVARLLVADARVELAEQRRGDPLAAALGIDGDVHDVPDGLVARADQVPDEPPAADRGEADAGGLGELEHEHRQRPRRRERAPLDRDHLRQVGIGQAADPQARLLGGDLGGELCCSLLGLLQGDLRVRPASVVRQHGLDRPATARRARARTARRHRPGAARSPPRQRRPRAPPSVLESVSPRLRRPANRDRRRPARGSSPSSSGASARAPASSRARGGVARGDTLATSPTAQRARRPRRTPRRDARRSPPARLGLATADRARRARPRRARQASRCRRRRPPATARARAPSRRRRAGR